MLTYGLIGFPLSHSFSEKYFSEKFRKENISDVQYKLFPFPNIREFPEFMRSNPGIRGLNVTIPYKEKIIPYLDEIEQTAKIIGAVNTIKVTRTKAGDRRLVGFNTDADGFEVLLKKFIGRKKPKALILGTGGSSKAVQFVLKKVKIPFTLVARYIKEQDPGISVLTYDGLNADILKKNNLVINCTPLGMSPAEESFPLIPYSALGKDHLLFDLVYNPEETVFLKKGKDAGAKTCNGSEMLHLQAERAWEIWNTK